MSLKPNDIIFNNSSIAFIPARGGSKRFPKKNIAKFFKKPLISYPIYEAIKSKVFTNVIVSTDDKQIMEIAKKYKADPVKRSKKNSDDNAHELEACREYFTNLSKKRIELPKLRNMPVLVVFVRSAENSFSSPYDFLCRRGRQHTWTTGRAGG